MTFRTNRTRIKFCGLTTIEDAVFAAHLGIDAIGFVFVSESIRKVNLKQALTIKKNLPPFINTVALFLDAKQFDITQVIYEFKPDLLQFHGNESASFCEQFKWPYIKAISVNGDVCQTIDNYKNACGILLDGHQPGQLAGQGRSFNWDNIPTNSSLPLIIAGGLNADNIKQVITQYKPYGVDVSSGIEKIKGVKDREKMENFIKIVNQANQTLE